ncbi:MAG: HDOD domain-containing protein [Nitrospirae bacterium]|nr:HDOD domain-containing protein [Nitrospirota bacterium]
MKEDVLERIILETVDVPSLPPVASKVLGLVSNDYTSVSQLEEIISQDEAFSTRILRIANSPYYGRGRGIDTISTAVILIGFNAMRSLVTAASLKDLHRKFGIFEEQHWEHSLGVSIASSLLAAQTEMMIPEEALIGGLIHDMGKIVINNSLSEEYRTVIDKMNQENISSIAAEDEILGFNHCNVGALIARKWKLPGNLEAVIEYHHAEQYPAFEDSGYETLCQIVQVADAMCLHMGIGVGATIDFSKIGFEQLGLTETQFRTLQERLKHCFNEQRDRLLE